MISVIFWAVVIGLLTWGIYDMAREVALRREWRRQWSELEGELDAE